MKIFSGSPWRLPAIGIVLLATAGVAAAQPAGAGWGPGFMMGPGMMHGRGMRGGRFDGPCDPGVAGMAGWRIDEIERAVRPTDAQRAALANLRAASVKAADTLKAACPREVPATSVQRLAFMEKRMESMLEAVKTVRPAFEAFYAAMSDGQKARLDAIGPRRHRWHWRW